MFALNTAGRTFRFATTSSSIEEEVVEYLEERSQQLHYLAEKYASWKMEMDGVWLRDETQRPWEVAKFSWNSIELVDARSIEVHGALVAPEEIKNFRQYLVQGWRENARKARAKKMAAKLGLEYWPALLWWFKEKSVDPRCFVYAEAALKQKAGGYWDGGQNRGGWDSQGAHGVSPGQVETYWRLAGCQNNEKFHWMVLNREKIKRGTTIKDHLLMRKGRRWVEKNRIAGGFTGKALRVLGKLSPPLRWAAVQGVSESGEWIRIRHLNWAAVKEVQDGPKYRRSKYCPPQLQWQMKGYRSAPKGLSGVSPMSASLKVYEEIFALVGELQVGHGHDYSADRLAAWRLAQVWKSTTRAVKYVKRWYGEPSRLTIHDAGQHGELPSGVTTQAWLALAEKFGPEVLRSIGLWALIEEKLGEVPTSLNKLREAALQEKYAHLCRSLEEREILERLVAAVPTMAEGELRTYLEFYREQPPKDAEYLPQVRVTGSDVGLEGDWVFEKLDYNDPTGPALGHMTGCCQHLNGAGAACARDGYLSPYSAFYVWRYKGKVVAQTWAWRGSASGTEMGDVLVFDSIEALGNAYVEGIAKLLKKAMEGFLASPLGITEIRLGVTGYGITPDVAQLLIRIEPESHALPWKYWGYMDGRQQEIIS